MFELIFLNFSPANLTCIAESIPNATIKWRLGDIEIPHDHPNMKIHGYGPVSSLIVTPYNEKRFFTRYECVASNKIGQNSHWIELKHAEVPRPVQQVKPESITATTIKFNIVGPPNFDGLPVRSFVVQYRMEQQFSWDQSYNHTWSRDAPHILENLIPQATYNFRFAARNDVGLGAWGGDQQWTMPKRSVPAEPRILSTNYDLGEENNYVPEDVITNSPYANHFELRWNVPNDNGDPILSYIIRYCVVSQKTNLIKIPRLNYLFFQ